MIPPMVVEPRRRSDADDRDELPQPIGGHVLRAQ